MTTTYLEIKEEIERRLSEFTDSAYPEDLLREEADSLTPVYNHEIIKEWAEMPSEFNDSWRQYGWDEYLEQGGILGLMRIDLMHYYESLTAKAYEELTAEAN
jgi:hypothetical protein